MKQKKLHILEILNSRGEEKAVFDRLCFLVEVGKSVSRYYDPEMRVGSVECVSADELNRICFYLAGRYNDFYYKSINCLLKLRSGFIKVDGFYFDKDLSVFLDEKLKSLRLAENDRKNQCINDWLDKMRGGPVGETVLDDTIYLAWQSPVQEAYNAVLRKRNVFPKRMLCIEPPQGLRTQLKSALKAIILGKWRESKKTFHNDLMPTLFEGRLDGGFLPQKKYIELITGRHCDVRKIRAGSINDRLVLEELKNFNGAAALFSGGGIIRDKILTQSGKRFVHFHPGKLPHTRGADGFFWSVLNFGYPSVSGLYQDVGIDTGEVINERSFGLPKFNMDVVEGLLRRESSHECYAFLYKAILQVYDPLLRAATLDSILTSSSYDGKFLRFGSLPSDLQREQGGYFHFMHPELRNRVIQEILSVQ